MGMMGFHVLFPEEAETECRAVTPVSIKDLPQRTFLFVEAYCVEPKCDCRRVMLNVIDAESGDQVATINYAFEPPEPPFDDEKQMFLDPLNGVSGALYCTLRSTNVIENLNGLVGHFVRHVRRWRDGRMLVRWIATGLREADRSFRRLRGHRDLAALIRALDRIPMDSRKEVA
jgi:hypothetical protein